MDHWVFVDTCIWASFFTKPSSPEKQAVDRLLDADRIVLVGPIVAEVLLGFRRKDQADWIASRLRLAHYVETEWNDWRATADLGAKWLRRDTNCRCQTWCSPLLPSDLTLMSTRRIRTSIWLRV